MNALLDGCIIVPSPRAEIVRKPWIINTSAVSSASARARALVDGFLESLKIAAMAEAYEVNAAPHNYYGHLASAICAHFCAVVPNLRVMEIDVDSAPWRDELFSSPMVIEAGDILLPKGSGWGIEVNEAGVRAHPPKT